MLSGWLSTKTSDRHQPLVSSIATLIYTSTNVWIVIPSTQNDLDGSREEETFQTGSIQWKLSRVLRKHFCGISSMDGRAILQYRLPQELVHDFFQPYPHSSGAFYSAKTLISVPFAHGNICGLQLSSSRPPSRNWSEAEQQNVIPKFWEQSRSIGATPASYPFSRTISESPHGVRLTQLRRAEVDAFCACDQTHVYSTGRTACLEQSSPRSPRKGRAGAVCPRAGRDVLRAPVREARAPQLRASRRLTHHRKDCVRPCAGAQRPAVTTIAVAASTRAVSLCARSAYAAVTGRCAQAAALLIPIGTASVRMGRCAQVTASPTIVGIFAHQRNPRDCRVHHGHAPTVTSLIGGVSSVHAAWCKPSPGSRPCYIWTVCKHVNLRLALALLAAGSQTGLARQRAPTHPSPVHGTYTALLDARDALALTIGDIRLPSHRLQSQPLTQLLPARCACELQTTAGTCTKMETEMDTGSPPSHRAPAQRRRCLKVKSDMQALRSGPCTCPQTQVQLQDCDYAALHQGTRRTHGFPQSTRPTQVNSSKVLTLEINRVRIHITAES
ncbi:hypothetical protein B0H14DRAFT_3166379 [Mycena olivaceomarginata]|nr:hypothetical protein B0H14DRAFT_3166379 [Mycena olivaceomarginata]